MTETGIETADGVREFDIIVWATGFDFGTGALTRMGIRGRDGVALDGPLGRRPDDVPRRADHRLPELLLPRRPARGGRQQPAVQRRPGRLRHRHARLRARPRLRHDRGRPRGRGAVDRHGRPRRRRTPPFGESSYFFGTNIPGKPRKYLLNSGGRPKLFKEIADVQANDYKGFRLSRS